MATGAPAGWPSNRQYARVPGTRTDRAGRGGGAGVGSGTFSGTENRFAAEVSSTSSRCSSVRWSSGTPVKYGENVDTSIVCRARSNRYSRIIALPP